MKNLSTNQIREVWLDYFKNHDHHIEPFKSLIPVNDNSLLFINSGVSTLKNYFSGIEVPPSNRIANAQKSIRTNDIENVGLTSRHHTLFEMLGNFSIGDYFKKEAVQMAYEILTSKHYFDLDINKLYFTIHPDDLETYNIWISLGVKSDKIIRLEENFWEIGKGPGGPNTEIFFDRGETYDTRDVVKLLKEDLENDRIIEIWNIVFSQYNCDPDNLEVKDYKELPQKNIDTGMGLERMACVMQQVESNYETDNFMAIINKFVSLTKIDYQKKKMAYRVISDHIRALCFSIADGIIPSNEGRGYVIRRILRRAVRYGYIDLGLNKPFLNELVETVVSVMSPYYDYLEESSGFIKEVIFLEEEKFLKTLSSGLKLINEQIKIMNVTTISGDVAFKLYDTYGFPIELTIEVAQEHGKMVDKDGFDLELKKQQHRAREAMVDNVAIVEQNAFLKTIEIQSKFIGYDYLTSNSKLLYITDLKTSFNSVIKGEFYLIFDNTPFYANGGGQVNDIGRISGADIIEIIKLPNGQLAHKINVGEKITINDFLFLEVNKKARSNIAVNHSATHLLHLALHKIIGPHAKQAGSLQGQMRTRFDFSSLKPLTKEQIIEINNFVNELIQKDEIVHIEQMSLESAKNLGANALFGEKYSDIVRVVKIGDSIELCGGTHVKRTSEISKFQIMLESGIGSGVRRIEAVCGKHATEYKNTLINEFDLRLNEIKFGLENLKMVSTVNLKDVLGKISLLYDKEIYILKLQEFELLEDQIKQVKSKIQSNNDLSVSAVIDTIILSKSSENKIDYKLKDFDPKNLKSLCDEIAKVIISGVIILSTQNDDKVSVVVKVTDDLVGEYNAGEIVKQYIKPFEGRGGGKPDMAQGGYQLEV